MRSTVADDSHHSHEFKISELMVLSLNNPVGRFLSLVGDAASMPLVEEPDNPLMVLLRRTDVRGCRSPLSRSLSRLEIGDRLNEAHIVEFSSVRSASFGFVVILRRFRTINGSNKLT